MDYKEVIRALVTSGFSAPEIITVVRQNAYNQLELVKFLLRLRAPNSALAAAGFPVELSDDYLDEATITRLVNTHLSSMDLFQTSVKIDSPRYGREVTLDRDWTIHLRVENSEVYNVAIALGYEHAAAIILSMTSSVWDPLKRLVSCGVIPIGLSVDGSFYVSRK